MQCIKIDKEKERWPRKVLYWEKSKGENTLEELQRTWGEIKNTNGMASQALYRLTVMTAAPLQALMKMTSNFLLTVLIVFSSLLNEFGWRLGSLQHFSRRTLRRLLNSKKHQNGFYCVCTYWPNTDNSPYVHVKRPLKYLDISVTLKNLWISVH